MKKATQQETKLHNRNLVLRTIFGHDFISRAEIARVTSLTRTTVSDIIADLLAEGLVSEVGLGESQGGKSPILLGLEADSRCVIALDLALTQFYGAVVNLRGKILHKVILPVSNRNGDEALALVYEIIDYLVQAACPTIVGIGVGAPGLVNPAQGVVLNAVNLDWKDLPLASLLQERYHLPVYVLNDSQAAAMGEFTYGDPHPVEGSLIVINARHGIGAGIIINGRLFPGDGGGAGEIGHVVVAAESGSLCRCGNRGCLETVASAQALVRQVSSGNLPRKPAGDLTLEVIRGYYEAGYPPVRQAVLDTGRATGRAIASLVGTLNIHHIRLVGDMTCFGEDWLAAIRETVSKTALPRLAEATQVEFGKLGPDCILLGASAMLVSNTSLLYQST